MQKRWNHELIIQVFVELLKFGRPCGKKARMVVLPITLLLESVQLDFLLLDAGKESS